MSTTWVVPVKPQNYDWVCDWLDDLGAIPWPNERHNHFEVGDIVYLYVSSPIKAVKFKCRVTDTNYYLPEVDQLAPATADSTVTDTNYYLPEDDDKNKSRVRDSFFTEGPFVEFTGLFEFESDGQTSYRALKAVGVTSQFMSNTRVDGVVADYLEKVENDQKNRRGSNDAIPSSVLVMPLDELRQIATKNSSVDVSTTRELVTQYHRDQYVALYAKRRANGICDLCENEAPFLDKNGQPYLESHHIVWLAQGGSDTIDNTVALCPNCHRKMHIVNDEKDVAKLKEIARRK